MAGGKVPREPRRMPVMSPVKMTPGVRVRVKVPTENGTVCPSRNSQARMKAIRVPLSVARRLS